MPTLHKLTLELDDALAQKLTVAAAERGWTPESLAADCVAQHADSDEAGHAFQYEDPMGVWIAT